jgi:hypothetical protein
MVSRWKKSVASSPAAWVRRKVRQLVSVRPWCGAEAGGGEDAADGSLADVVPEPGEFSLDAAMPPPRIFPGQPGDQVTEFVVDRWASWSVGVGPFSCDETAMPCQQRAGCDDAVSA